VTREAAHVDAGLGDHFLGAPTANANDLIERAQLHLKRAEPPLDLLTQPGFFSWVGEMREASF